MPVLLVIRHVVSGFVISLKFFCHIVQRCTDETLEMDFTMKRPRRAIIPPVSIPTAIVDVRDYPTPDECLSATEVLYQRNWFSICHPADRNDDGVYLGNIWRPEPLNEARHLPHEHPFRDEWNTPTFDVPWLDCSHEALPMAWLPREFKRLFAWEFAIHLVRQRSIHRKQIAFAAYRGRYTPVLIFYGCNAIRLQPEPSLYPLVKGDYPPGKRMFTAEQIASIVQMKSRLTKGPLDKTQLGPLVIPQASIKPKNFVLTVAEALADPLFYWRLPSYVERENLSQNRVDDYPDDDTITGNGFDLEAEQYCWDNPAYDDFSLDFSHSVTPPGWTRIQHLRYSAYCVNLAKLRMARFRRRW